MSDVYYNRTVYNKLKHYESLIGLNSQQPWHSAWPVGVHAANSVVAPGREGAGGSTEACGGTDAELSGTDRLGVLVARDKAVGLSTRACEVNGRACDLARLAQVVGDRVGLGDPMVPAADGTIGRDALADEEAQDAQRCGLLAEKHLCKEVITCSSGLRAVRFFFLSQSPRSPRV